MSSFVHTKNYQNQFVFDWVIKKIQRVSLFWNKVHIKPIKHDKTTIYSKPFLTKQSLMKITVAEHTENIN